MGKIVFVCMVAIFALAALSISNAQQLGRIPRVGVLVAGFPPTRPALEGFRQGLRDLGHIEGKTIILELLWDEGKPERWHELASDLVRLKVDIILAGNTGAASAAKKATTTIPIVIGAAGGDPVTAGLVASFARPGGNVTGMAFVGRELAPKRLELLKEAIPRISRVAALRDASSFQNPDSDLKEITATAQGLGLKLHVSEVRQRDDIERVFQGARRERVGAVLILQSTLFGTFRSQIAELGVKHLLPTMAGEAEFAESGGLMFYGQNIPDTWKRAAAYVDKIIKGTQPADLPIERPRSFELVINLKTAKQIGLTIPPNLLVRADKVIR